MDKDDLQNMQTLLAHHERQIQDLSDIVTAQQREIDALKLRLEKTNLKMAEMELGFAQEQGEILSVTDQALRDKPPHY